jgi:putative glutamine amidotransferase
MSDRNPHSQPDRRPRIGLAAISEEGRMGIPATYVTAVERAGGLPIIVPATGSAAIVDAFVDLLDGLLIPGGDGIMQGLIGDLPDDLPPVTDTRWNSDVGYFEAMTGRKKPILGICYGMQFINAMRGGSIYADVQRQRQNTAPHAPRRGADSHPLRIVTGTRLASLIGDSPIQVNSFHLQAVASAGQGLRVNAYSDDGLIEGIESADGLLLGLQCHPERMPDTLWANVFADFVRKCVP